MTCSSPRLLFTLVCLFSVARAAVAQPAAPMSDAEASARLTFLQGALDDGRHSADLWFYGWLGGYGAATAGQLVARSSSHDEKQRQDLLVGAATTGLGVLGLAVFPVEAGKLARRLRALPADTPEARRAKLAAAERFLREAAAQETLGRSWQAHAAAAAVNLGAGLVLWRHYDRPARDGAVTFAVGQLVSEIQIFTQPTRAIRALREYERRSDFAPAAEAGRRRADWYLVTAPNAVAVGVRF